MIDHSIGRPRLHVSLDCRRGRGQFCPTGGLAPSRVHDPSLAGGKTLRLADGQLELFGSPTSSGDLEYDCGNRTTGISRKYFSILDARKILRDRPVNRKRTGGAFDLPPPFRVADHDALPALL
jgi:hypothetical protein